LHPINLPGLNVSALDGIKRVEEPELTITTFDLILLLKEGPSGLVGFLIYKADVFDEAIIDRILGDFHAILQRIIFELKRSDIGILMTDHNVRETLMVTDRAYIINNGKIFRSGRPDALSRDPEVRRVYLGENFNFGIEYSPKR